MIKLPHAGTVEEPRRTRPAARPRLWSTLLAARYDLLALAILFVAITLFHWRGIRPGQTFLPVDLANNTRPWLTQPHGLQNWLVSDPIYEFYPFLAHAVNTIKTTGTWPLWNPDIFLGHPAAADPLMQTFYPFFIIPGLLLGAARGLAIGVWLHVLLAGVLTYGLLRTLRCDWRAALLGALTYALSGYLVTWLESLFRVATLAWLPGVLWMFELSLRQRSVAYAALGGLALGLAILGGHFMFLVTFSIFLGLWAVGRTLAAVRSHQPAPAWALLSLAVIGIIGGMVGAAQAVPFAEFLGMTRRVVDRGLTDPLPWRQLVSLVVPNFFGNPAAAAGTGAQYWGEGNYAETTIYSGLVALLLAGAAPLSTRRRRTWYLFGLALVLVYFVVGGPGVQALAGVPLLKYTSLHRSAFLLPLILALLAGFGLSEPALRPRAVLVVAAALATWAALGWWLNWNDVQAHGQAFVHSLTVAAVILGTAVALLLARAYWARLRPIIDLCLVALVFCDLFIWGSRFSPAGPVARLMPPTPVIDFLAAQPGAPVVEPYQRSELLFGPNVLSLYGIHEASGYSSLVVNSFYQLIAAGDPKIELWWMDRGGNIMSLSHPTDRLLDLLRVNDVVSNEPWGEPQPIAEQVIDSCAGDSGEIGGAQTASGVFTVRTAAINRVDVRLHPASGVQPGAALVLRLCRGADRTTLAAEVRQDLKPASGDQTATFYFAPEKEAAGQTYAWEISAADGHATGMAVCHDAQKRPAVSVYGTEGYQAFAGNGVYVFERFSALPRAYVVYAAEQGGDDAAATARLLDPAFDVRNVVLAPGSTGLPATPTRPATRAQVTESADQRVVIQARADQSGMLVLDDQYHPGWQAQVDDRSVPIQRVNQFMRGVALPAGEHRVVFTFAPLSVKIGLGLTVAGLILAAALIVVPLYVAHRQRRRLDPPPQRGA